jgi:hypothetical protein
MHRVWLQRKGKRRHQSWRLCGKLRRGAGGALADEQSAERHYTLGVACCAKETCKETELALRLNRALANLGLQRPGPALNDLLWIEETFVGPHAIVITEAQRHKLVFRKLQAAYELRLWQTAHEALDQCKKAKLEVAKWTSYESRLKIRGKEEKGDWDWLSCLGLMLRNNLDHSDYIGPIDVRTVEGRGRGMFLTKDVTAGQVLFVERSLCTTTSDNALIGQAVDVETGPRTIRKFNNEVGAVVHAVMADHSRLPIIYALYPHPSRESPIMCEQERIDCIRSPLGVINIEQVFKKHLRNAFGSNEANASSSSLHGLASLLNHSCLPNTGRNTVGQVCALPSEPRLTDC